jgi:hypothetical protein
MLMVTTIIMWHTLDAFSQFKFSYDKVDFYLAQSFSSTNYQREGLYKWNLWNDLFGKSEKLQFENFGFKGGLTYKLSGKQLLTFNGAHLTKRQRSGIPEFALEQLDSWRTAKWEYK